MLTKFHTEISHWYGGHTYSALFQEVDGDETFYENDISASRNVAINFLGGATGDVTVTSTGKGNIYLLGNVLDPGGNTTIDAEHGSILSGGNSQLLTGQSVTLDAGGTGTGALLSNGTGSKIGIGVSLNNILPESLSVNELSAIGLAAT